jgi:hypothetical protein
MTVIETVLLISNFMLIAGVILGHIVDQID